MISEEKIAEWERILKLTPADLEKYPCDDRTRLLSMMKAGLAEDAVPNLIARVRELEKEADWIAENADSCPPGLTYDIECLKDKGLSCKDCWRKKAREATAE